MKREEQEESYWGECTYISLPESKDCALNVIIGHSALWKKQRSHKKTVADEKKQHSSHQTSCGAQSVRQQEFTNLSLDLIPGGSVEEMLQEYLNETEVEFRCDCGGNTSSCRSSLLTLPQVLILQLKRFRYSPFFELEKVDDPVRLIRDLLVSSTQDGGCYNLVSTISHFGSTGTVYQIFAVITQQLDQYEANQFTTKIELFKFFCTLKLRSFFCKDPVLRNSSNVVPERSVPSVDAAYRDGVGETKKKQSAKSQYNWRNPLLQSTEVQLGKPTVQQEESSAGVNKGTRRPRRQSLPTPVRRVVF
ncbi:hypothetical protein ABVT39_013209 [Epinephelus coioides]